MGSTCSICGCNLPRANLFSNGPDALRCARCMANQSDSGRYNRSNHAVFELSALECPFAQGTFRWVAKGSYQNGERRGQVCVAKWFKTGAVFEYVYFSLDIKDADKTLEIADRFNQLKFIDKTVKIDVPEVWEHVNGSRKGQKVLVEPFIQNYQKFNSDSGWNDESRDWALAMQALSHFSYHDTGGAYVLCDLKGGIYQHEVVLSDPVILSRTREFGVTDLGPDGISSSFSYHRCNRYCRPAWSAPANPRRHFRPVPGTTMVRHSVPTAWSRPFGTSFYGMVAGWDGMGNGWMDGLLGVRARDGSFTGVVYSPVKRNGDKKAGLVTILCSLPWLTLD